MSKDITVIVVARTTDPTIPIVGRTKTTCDECQHEVWIAPKSRLLRRIYGYPVLCTHCVRAKYPEELKMATVIKYPEVN